MTSPTQPHTQPHTRLHTQPHARPQPVQWLMWCLLFALAVGGCSSTAVRMLGTSHHHRDHRDQSVLHANAAAMAGWQDFRRASHRHQSAPAPHMAQQRHPHATGDASVVALDAGSDAGSGAGSGGTAQGDSKPAGGDATVLMFALGTSTPRAAPGARCWPAVGAAAVPRPHPERLERPPQT